MLRTLGEFTKQTSLKLLIVGVALLLSYAIHAENAQRPASTRYEQRTPSRDGIGKFYMGREISHVMGHQGAEWLERPEREREEMPNILVELLKLKEGDVVADIGDRYRLHRSPKISPKIGETGIVYGVDIQQEMLDLLDEKMAGGRYHKCQRECWVLLPTRNCRRNSVDRGNYGGCLPRVFASV